MGSIKPFVCGAALGAGLAFVALQYHVIQSKDGFRVIPRSPQHSLGLTYADVRYWTPEQWADRPELVTALAADGATEIVGDSVAGDVLRTVAPTGGTLDQLRSFLNESSTGRDSTDSLFDSSSLTIPESSGQTSSDADRFSVPFPDDARRETFESAQREAEVRPIPTARREKPSIDDVFSETVDRIAHRSTSEYSAASPPQTNPSAQQEDLLGEMLFGDDSTPANSSTTSTDEESGFGVFEDVTDSLESRGEEVMERARQGVRNELSRSVQDSASATNRFVRQQVQKSIPESVMGMFKEVPATAFPQDDRQSPIPDAIRALRDGFDPFVD